MSTTESRTRIRLTQSGWAVLRSMLGRELSMAHQLTTTTLEDEQMAKARRYKREIANLVSEVDRAGAQMGWNRAGG